jgi:hypothetical protein
MIENGHLKIKYNVIIIIIQYMNKKILFFKCMYQINYCIMFVILYIEIHCIFNQ